MDRPAHGPHGSAQVKQLWSSVSHWLSSLRPDRVREEPVEIQAGMSFARMIASNVTETAEVNEVVTDSSGIPHIRFTVWVRDQNGLHDEGTRMLSQSSFLNTYHKLR